MISPPFIREVGKVDYRLWLEVNQAGKNSGAQGICRGKNLGKNNPERSVSECCVNGTKMYI